MRDVKSFLGTEQDRPFIFGNFPAQSTSNFENVKFDLGQSGGMASGERVELLSLDIVLIGTQIQNAHVVTSRLLGLADDGRQRVREIFEQPILQIHRHSQDTIQEFRYVVVILVQRKDAGIRFTVADHSHTDQSSGNI